MLSLMIRTEYQVAELYLYQDDKCLLAYSWTADRHLAETLNREIDNLLKKAKRTLNQLEGIGIYSGPGSFTALRIGHSVANALSYGLKLPIVQANGDNWLEQAASKLNSGQNDHLAMPKYGAPVHITSPRK